MNNGNHQELVVFGLSHHTAPLEMREGFSLTPEKMDMESFEQYFDEDSSAEPAATFAAAVSGQQLTRQLIDAVSAKFPAKNMSVSPVRASEALARASKGS